MPEPLTWDRICKLFGWAADGRLYYPVTERRAQEEVHVPDALPGEGWALVASVCPKVGAQPVKIPRRVFLNLKLTDPERSRSGGENAGRAQSS